MSAPERPLGIIAALSEEVRHLGHALTVDDKIVRGSYSFRQGRLDDAPVVLVEAGIGKVNTALVATLLLDHFGCRSVLLTATSSPSGRVWRRSANRASVSVSISPRISAAACTRGWTVSRCRHCLLR